LVHSISTQPSDLIFSGQSIQQEFSDITTAGVGTYTVPQNVLNQLTSYIIIIITTTITTTTWRYSRM
jgi:hypothetical protein